MADLMALERLVPCLLDRLTDDEPRRRKEGRDQRVISPRRYIEAARRDLKWLLNAGAKPSNEAIYDYPEAVKSVLNYGVPDLCGLTASGISPEEIARRLRQAILAFEPRILRSSLVVQVYVQPEAMGPTAVSFEIAGELWAQPAPEAFYVKTDVDLETGQWEL